MKRKHAFPALCLALVLACALLLSGCRSQNGASGPNAGMNGPGHGTPGNPTQTEVPTEAPTQETPATEAPTQETPATEAPTPEEPSTEMPAEPAAPTEPEPSDGLLPFTAEYLRTDSYAEGAKFPRSRLVNSRAELLAFYAEFRNLGGSPASMAVRPAALTPLSAAGSFETATAHYDDAFFETHSLLVVQLEEGSGSNRHEVTGVTREDGRYRVEIKRLVPEVGTCDMAEWHILIALPKDSSKVDSDRIEVSLTTEMSLAPLP